MGFNSAFKGLKITYQFVVCTAWKSWCCWTMCTLLVAPPQGFKNKHIFIKQRGAHNVCLFKSITSLFRQSRTQMVSAVA